MTRVGVIGPTDPDSFADNILDCLPDLGVEAVRLGTPRPEFRQRRLSAVYDFAARARPSLDARVQQQIVKRAGEAEVDIIVSTQSELLPETVQALRHQGARVALWFPDHIANLGRGLMFVAPYTRVYFKDPEVVERSSRLQGTPAAYLPEACNPHWHKPQDGQPGDEAGIVVAGNMYPTRAILLKRMVDNGFPLRLFGASFPSWLPQRAALAPLHAGRPVVRHEKARTFRRAQAVLNNIHPSELTSMNCRLFEAAGSGAAVLTEYRPTLDDLFDLDSEVLAFRSYDELQSQWKRLQDDPELGRQIGDAAAARAAADHTYQVRLARVLEDLA